jgi:hypothetical protein
LPDTDVGVMLLSGVTAQAAKNKQNPSSAIRRIVGHLPWDNENNALSSLS